MKREITEFIHIKIRTDNIKPKNYFIFCKHCPEDNEDNLGLNLQFE